MKYPIKSGSDGDRRSDKRKKIVQSIPVEVQGLPVKKGGIEGSAEKNVQAVEPVSYEKLRETPRKQTPQEIRASIMVDGFSNGVIADVSKGGLRINSVIKLQLEKEIGVFFKLPGQNTGITLICQVRWLKECKDGMSHCAGLKIIRTSNDQGFCAFVDNLPLIEAASN